jgi:hypothetical protein
LHHIWIQRSRIHRIRIRIPITTRNSSSTIHDSAITPRNAISIHFCHQFLRTILSTPPVTRPITTAVNLNTSIGLNGDIGESDCTGLASPMSTSEMIKFVSNCP